MSDQNQPRNGSGSGSNSGAQDVKPRGKAKRPKRRSPLPRKGAPKPESFGLEPLPKR